MQPKPLPLRPPRPQPTRQRRNPLAETLTYAGAEAGSQHIVRLPSRCPLWLDLRRWLLLGWVTIETPGYLATVKVHYKPSHWGIAGTRVHTLHVWAYSGQTVLPTADCVYQSKAGVVLDRGDPGATEFINLILEYFK